MSSNRCFCQFIGIMVNKPLIRPYFLGEVGGIMPLCLRCIEIIGQFWDLFFRSVFFVGPPSG